PPPPPAKEPPAAPAPERPRTNAPEPSRGAGPAASTPAPARAQTSGAPRAAASVTEWAVAPIPRDDDAPLTGSMSVGLAVDDEPEEAEAAPMRIATLAPPQDGDVVPVAEAEARPEPEEDLDVAGPGRRATTKLRSATGVERYGEAVVRQVLGATFVREEPYEPPTRFQ